MAEGRNPFPPESSLFSFLRLGPLEHHGNGLVTCSLRRVVALYLVGIALGFAAGVVFVLLGWWLT